MHKVVIIGVGFGELAAARALSDQEVGITLVDQHNFHTFLPLLYEVATAGPDPGDVAYPARAVIGRTPNIRFRPGTVLDQTRRHPTPPKGSPGEISLFGNLWQWTSSAYSPYPGFEPAKGAVGKYNGKFMVNQYVLRGGSSVTPPGHVRSSYRNFFPASAR